MAEIPQKIGKYKIVRALGKGAMGMVYEGFDPVIERRVAVKTILASYLEAAEIEEAVARFKREAQAGGRLQHPGIVGVYEYGEDGEMAFIVMEFVDGQELKAFFKEGRRFELIDVFEIMKQLLAALDYSHRQGVVHRDIKPANLMILPGPKLKIMDFGIARLETSSLTQVGTVVGTPTHMAPEQLMGIPADGRADLWSSGVILYELLTGVSPFLAETPAQVMHKVLQAELVLPSAHNGALPPGFDGVVMRALARRPEDRYPSAKDFQVALLQALQGKNVASPAHYGDPERTLSPAEAVKAEATRTAMKKVAFALAPETIVDLERSLTRHIGPLAKVLIKQGQAKAASLDEFFQVLANNIPDEEERREFIAKTAPLRKTEAARETAEASSASAPKAAPAAAAPAKKASTGATRINFTPESLAIAEKRLASYVGPLARVLIKDAVGKSGNLRELYLQLAGNIDDEEERRAFLAEFER